MASNGEAGRGGVDPCEGRAGEALRGEHVLRVATGDLRRGPAEGAIGLLRALRRFPLAREAPRERRPGVAKRSKRVSEALDGPRLLERERRGPLPPRKNKQPFGLPCARDDRSQHRAVIVHPPRIGPELRTPYRERLEHVAPEDRLGLAGGDRDHPFGERRRRLGPVNVRVPGSVHRRHVKRVERPKLGRRCAEPRWSAQRNERLADRLVRIGPKERFMRRRGRVEPGPACRAQGLFNPRRRGADPKREDAEDRHDRGRIPRSPLRDRRAEEHDWPADNRERHRATRGSREGDRIPPQRHVADEHGPERDGHPRDRLGRSEPDEPYPPCDPRRRGPEPRRRVHPRRHAELEPADARDVPRFTDQKDPCEQACNEREEVRLRGEEAGRGPVPDGVEHPRRERDDEEHPQDDEAEQSRRRPLGTADTRPRDPVGGRDARHRPVRRERRNRRPGDPENRDPSLLVRRPERRHREREPPLREPPPRLSPPRDPREPQRQKRRPPPPRPLPSHGPQSVGRDVGRGGEQDESRPPTEEPLLGGGPGALQAFQALQWRTSRRHRAHRAKRST